MGNDSLWSRTGIAYIWNAIIGVKMLPRLNQLFVAKKEIRNDKVFFELLELYDLKVIFDEPQYFIIDGDDQDLHDFKEYWQDT